MNPPIPVVPLSGDALVAKARTLAEAAHAGQFRANGKTPYIEHPLAVERELMERWGNVLLDAGIAAGTPEDADLRARGRAVALLHDVAESDAAHRLLFDDLAAAGIGSVVEELRLLTKKPDATYLDYILTIRGRLILNPLAYWVKISDFAANMATIDSVPDKRRARNMLTKWQMGEWILTH